MIARVNRQIALKSLPRAPQAFIGLLEGHNFGKRLVRVSEDPTVRAGR